MDSDVLIIGTGGHARVVAEIIRAGDRRVAGFVAPPGQAAQSPIPELPLLDWESARQEQGRFACIVGIGDNILRQEVQEEAEAAGFRFTTAVHPSAVVGSEVLVGAGCVVAARAVLVLSITVGRGAIVNTAASVDHDVRIGNWCHVGPGGVLAGSVTLGDGVFVGAGGVIINGISVGEYSVVGAGGVVVGDLPQHVVAVGVPATILRDDQE